MLNVDWQMRQLAQAIVSAGPTPLTPNRHKLNWLWMFSVRWQNEIMKELLKRITVNPAVMTGLPCIRGLGMIFSGFVGRTLRDFSVNTFSR